LPLGLPREPISGSALATVPLSKRTIVAGLLSAVTGFFLFWLILAYRRARRTDPLAPRRTAHARLEKLLPALNLADPTVLRAQLIAWQHDTALLLRLPVAAPTLADLDRASTESAALKTLWAEADRTLYGENISLPIDWSARARTALAALPLPRFSPFRLFLPRNLFPFIAALALAVIITPAQLLAADGAADYRRGDFPAAEKAYRVILAANPTDALAHHNLSLALAQQDRWDEAAAHASAALVQAPTHEAIRAQFTLAAEKSGHVPAALAAFLAPGPLEKLARLQAPAAWQVTLLVAAGVFLLSTAGLLVTFFQHPQRSERARRRSRRLAYAAIIVSLIVSTGALTSLFTYGPASDARAAIAWRAGTLRSIPTEADTTQKTTPLAAGSLAAVDQKFLGWRHLTFPSGQTGWVRAEDLVPLWR
jgi:tetratricopeptide (TPR) repeat protein